ncbi:PD-(D/E)XK nuclease family protein [Kineosporia sp. J2-2]|uniref:PD-(D/E)XK nuclease family protein n=1 Tax=Kineosporia corallincola TaxID=2835133 RepID=A0ABS5TJZ4_9ACTN|nr:PD-(D/E)XK nuclease family protein [Kineosporia corallincola]MBT0770383.1 PD-(D/E)XK nuclease family protein [Kineosporia corallincola]
MNDQLELIGMPEPLYSCTPTRLAGWRDCRRRYRFTYLDRPQPPKGPPWAHNSIGAAVHSALADWWATPVARRTPETAYQLVRKRWLSDGFQDRDQSAEAGRRAVGWVQDYLFGSDTDPMAEPPGVERTVQARTARLSLSGRVDLIDLRDDELVVVDYKTGRHVPDEADAFASLALAVYAVGTARTYRRDCVQVELHHLPTQTRAVARYDLAGLERRLAEADSLGAEAAAADAGYARGRTGDDAFPPAPGSWCGYCDFRRHCPEGRAASPERPPWNALLNRA